MALSDEEALVTDILKAKLVKCVKESIKLQMFCYRFIQICCILK